jgi:hypothetical protein
VTLKDIARGIAEDNARALERYAKRPYFRDWAYRGGPDENRAMAIIKDGPGLVWVDLYVDRGDVKEFRRSGGAFYDTGDPNDHPEGALEWARRSAIAHVERQKSFTASRPSMPPGTKRG